MSQALVLSKVYDKVNTRGKNFHSCSLLTVSLPSQRKACKDMCKAMISRYKEPGALGTLQAGLWETYSRLVSVAMWELEQGSQVRPTSVNADSRDPETAEQTHSGRSQCSMKCSGLKVSLELISSE